MKRKEYVVNGCRFADQKSLDAAIKLALNSHPVNEQFTDTFLADVINELHADVRAAGQRATGAFRYLDWKGQVARGMDTAERYRGGHCLFGFFEPLGEWRDVTAYPHRKPDVYGLLTRALREKAAPLLPHPQRDDVCSVPGCERRGFELEYGHKNPTFKQIADECIRRMSDEEIESRFGYNKFVPGRDHLVYCIPDHHPAVEFLRVAHLRNEWAWLCKAHHRNVGLFL